MGDPITQMVDSYICEFVYDSTHYSIFGSMPQVEFEKMISSIYFE